MILHIYRTFSKPNQLQPKYHVGKKMSPLWLEDRRPPHMWCTAGSQGQTFFSGSDFAELHASIESLGHMSGDPVITKDLSTWRIIPLSKWLITFNNHG